MDLFLFHRIVIQRSYRIASVILILLMPGCANVESDNTEIDTANCYYNLCIEVETGSDWAEVRIDGIEYSDWYVDENSWVPTDREVEPGLFELSQAPVSSVIGEAVVQTQIFTISAEDARNILQVDIHKGNMNGVDVRFRLEGASEKILIGEIHHEGVIEGFPGTNPKIERMRPDLQYIPDPYSGLPEVDEE